MPVGVGIVQNCSIPAAFSNSGENNRKKILRELPRGASLGIPAEFFPGIPYGVQTRISHEAPPIIRLDVPAGAPAEIPLDQWCSALYAIHQQNCLVLTKNHFNDKQIVFKLKLSIEAI